MKNFLVTMGILIALALGGYATYKVCQEEPPVELDTPAGIPPEIIDYVDSINNPVFTTAEDFFVTKSFYSEKEIARNVIYSLPDEVASKVLYVCLTNNKTATIYDLYNEYQAHRSVYDTLGKEPTIQEPPAPEKKDTDSIQMLKRLEPHE